MDGWRARAGREKKKQCAFLALRPDTRDSAPPHSHTPAARPARTQTRTVLRCVSVAVIPALDVDVKECAMADSSTTSTVHSANECVRPSAARQVRPTRTRALPCWCWASILKNESRKRKERVQVERG